MAPPLVSVVVPTYERPAQLDQCLAALASQSLTTDRFEVVVVDDGGSTPAEPVVAAHRAGLSIVLRRQDNARPAAARNAGAAVARGDLLAFTDDDCAPDPNWLATLVTALGEHPRALVGGRTVNALPANPFAEASQVLLDFLYREGVGVQSTLPAFFASNNMALERRSFALLGGFDPMFPSAAGEDRDFCDRWAANAGELHYEQHAVMRHAHPMGLRGFLRQHVEYGRGAYRFHEARKARGDRPLRAGPPAFYFRMFAHVLRTLPATRSAKVAPLVGLSQAATAAGFLAESVAWP